MLLWLLQVLCGSWLLGFAFPGICTGNVIAHFGRVHQIGNKTSPFTIMKNQRISLVESSSGRTSDKETENSKNRNDMTKVVKFPTENDENTTLADKNGVATDADGKGDLASDVVEDGAPLTPPNPVSVLQSCSEQKLAGLIDKLTIRDEEIKGKNPALSTERESRPEMLSGEDISCEKAAKDLSNLLKVLHLQDESKPTDSLKDRVNANDEAIRLLEYIDRGLSTLELGSVKSPKQSLKSRGFGDLEECSGDFWDSTRWMGELDLQPAADLADYFSRQGSSDMFTTPSPQTQSQSPVVRNQSPRTFWREYNTLQDVTNMNHQGRFSDLLSGPPSQNYQYPASRGLTNLQNLSVNSGNRRDRVLNDFARQRGPGSYGTLTSDAKRKKYSEWNQHDSIFDYPTSDTNGVVFSAHNIPRYPVPNQLYTTADSGNAISTAAYSTASSSQAHRNSTVHSAAFSSGRSTGIPSPSSVYSSDMSASSPGSALSPQSQRSSSPSDTSHLSRHPSSSDSGISMSLYSPYSQQSASSPGSPTSQPASAFSTEASLANHQNQVPSTNMTVRPAAQDMMSGLPASVANRNQSGDTFSGPLPVPAIFLQTVGQQRASNNTYEHIFHYRNEDGDGLVHILVYVYEGQLMSGNREAADRFLQYISSHFLSHQLIRTCLNQRNNQLQTPLYLAVCKNLVSMVKLLVKYGADVNIQGRWQAEWERIPQLDAPLHAAVAMGDRGLNLVKTLLTSNAADVNVLNTEGETPLHVAAREHKTPDLCDNRVGVKSCIKIIQFLVQIGADMMAKDYKSGKTPLMLAIESRDVQLVRTMLDISGPRMSHHLLNECAHGLNTCMHLAFGLNHIEQSKHVELIRLLVRHGGEAETENSANYKAKDLAPHIYTKAVEIWR